jgi:hypothetical protein
MDLFPMGGVLRRFLASTYKMYASAKNLCAALPIEKISHSEKKNAKCGASKPGLTR